MPAESEGVGHGGPHRCLPGHIGHEVKVALGIGGLVVDGGRNDTLLDGEHGEDGLDPPCASQEVTCHGLGGADRQLVCMLPEDRFDGLGLRFVVQLGGCAVGVDVSDVVEIRGGMFKQRHQHVVWHLGLGGAGHAGRLDGKPGGGGPQSTRPGVRGRVPRRGVGCGVLRRSPWSNEGN